ncbi:MAG TPA: hypothetical protein VH560_16600, partial [Polyangia bacterium]|nr:hypothetical protein [Polyangia bacterium]
HHANNRAGDPLYGTAALRRTADALAPEGVVAIWSEEPDAAFEARLEAFFTVERHRGARGGRKHVVYLGKRDNRPRFAAPQPRLR